MALLCATNALRCPAPSRQLGHCHDGRRLQFAGATGANISALPASGRNIKLSTGCMPARTAAEQESLRFPMQAEGLANVLAIGTANPANCVLQEDYPDWFFRVTDSDHLTHLKTKMKKICGKTEIHKRYFHHDEELLRSHPDFLDGTLPSLDARQAIAATAVPELAAAAGANAIAEWGRPASDITHVIFCTYSATHMPGADLRLASLLGLGASVERTMLYYNGCNSGSVALRLAKDIAENNRGARVLVACAEITLVFFRAPDEARTDTLVVPALFGDGAGAVVVGSDPEAGTERPLFEMVSSAQAAIPWTEHVVSTTLGKCGLVYELSSELPSLVAANIERCLVDAWQPLALGQLMSGDWNDLFWVVHPGGRAVLDGVQDALGLDECKLKASRRVLSEYSNMSGVTIIFVLDEMRRRCRHSNGDKEDGVEDMEKESEWGAMVGFGPGLTVETMLLRAMGN
ncbi:chalcone synthase H1-like [Miscanthus floridulus]|uniref:chalcone synthase H1-like n=1 Tax=Miscanthus floridulus TaxID=154761 RepID=UPI0034598B40